MRQGCREDLEYSNLIHQLNQRYRDEFDRAEQLQAELNAIRGSRLWPWYERLRSFLRRWKKPGPIRAGQQPQSMNTPALAQRDSGFEIFDPQPQLPFSQQDVSIIIPFRDQFELLQRCVQPLRRTVHDAQVILVDNESQEHCTKAFLDAWQSRRQGLVVHVHEPFNFPRLCNAGAAVAQGKVLLFLNNDVLAAQPNWLESMMEVIADPRIGIVGATLLYPDRTIQHAGLMPSGPGGQWEHPYRYCPETHLGKHGELRRIRTVPAVTGACLMIRKDVFAAIGGFDDRFAVTGNDVDLCQRVQEKGLLVAITPFARLWHFESLSRGYRREAA